MAIDTFMVYVGVYSSADTAEIQKDAEADLG